MRHDGRVERLMAPVRRLVGWLSSRPRVRNLFRGVFEFNFIEENRIIARELLPRAANHREPGRRPRILDLGCGTGELAPSFLDAGYEYHGIDIEPELVKYAARMHSYGEFRVMDASALNYPDGYFDQIPGTGVLHHLPDALVHASSARCTGWVMAPGGRALVMEDIALRGSHNLLGALVHLADEGLYIRRQRQYLPLFKPQFRLVASYPVRCGVCDYQAFVVQSEPVANKGIVLDAVAAERLSPRTRSER